MSHELEMPAVRMLLGQRLRLEQSRRAVADVHVPAVRSNSDGGRVTLSEFVAWNMALLREYGLIKGEGNHATE